MQRKPEGGFSVGVKAMGFVLGVIAVFVVGAIFTTTVILPMYNPHSPHINTGANTLFGTWDTITTIWAGTKTDDKDNQSVDMVLTIENKNGNAFSGSESDGTNTVTLTGNINGSSFAFTDNMNCTYKGTVSQGTVQDGTWTCPNGQTGKFNIGMYVK